MIFGIAAIAVTICSIAIFGLTYTDFQYLPMGYRALGDEYLLSGDTTEALAMYDRALATGPMSAVPCYKIGLIQLARSKVDSAKIAFKRVIELDPESFEGYYQLGVIEFYNLSNPESSLKWLATAVEKDPKYFPAGELLASAYLGLGRIKESERVARAAYEANPTLAQARDLQHKFDAALVRGNGTYSDNLIGPSGEFFVRSDSGNADSLTVVGYGWRPGRKSSLSLFVDLDGKQLPVSEIPTYAPFRVVFSLADSDLSQGFSRVVVRIEPSFVPKSVGVGEDARELGGIIDSISFN